MTANVDPAPITRTEDVARLLQPVVVGGDILAYSYVRELHRAFGIESTIVLATQNIKMLSESRFTDYRLEPHIHEQEGLYNALERIAQEVHGAHPEKTLLILGCDDCHARMLSQGKQRLQDLGYVVPYIDFPLLDDITQKRRFYEICEELDIPFPKTWYFDCGNGPDELPVDEFPYPLIAKPSKTPSPPLKAGERSMRSKAPKNLRRFGAASVRRTITTFWCCRTSSPAATTPSARSPRFRTPPATCA